MKKTGVGAAGVPRRDAGPAFKRQVPADILSGGPRGEIGALPPAGLMRRRPVRAPLPSGDGDAAVLPPPPVVPLPAGVFALVQASRLTGLVEGAAVPSVADGSGNGWNFAQPTAGSQPIYTLQTGSGLPAIHFPVTADRWLANAAASLPYEGHFCYVIAETVYTPAGGPYFAASAGPGGTAPGGVGMGFGSGGAAPGAPVCYYDGGGGFHTFSTLGQLPCGPSLFILAPTATGFTAYTALGQEFSAGGERAVTLTGLSIGSWSPVAASFGFMGNLHEAGWYARNPTTADIAALRAYAAARYGVAVVKPRVNLVVFGDSITAGLCPSLRSWVHRLTDGGAFAGATVRCDGWAGLTAQAVAASSASQAATFDASYGSNVGVLALGINDAIAGRTPAQVVADLETIGTALRAAGFGGSTGKLLVATSTSDGAGLTVAQNAAVRAAAGFFDGVIDFGHDPNIGDGAPNTGPYYYGNFVHPSDLGQSLMSSIAAPVLAPLAF